MNVLSEPRSGSNRSTLRHRRTNVSCTISSAIPLSPSSLSPNANSGFAYRAQIARRASSSSPAATRDQRRLLAIGGPRAE
jgi:hypothetical protein